MSISSFAKNSLDQNGSKKKIVDWKIDLYNEVNCNCVKLSGKKGYMTIFCNDIFTQGDIAHGNKNAISKSKIINKIATK